MLSPSDVVRLRDETPGCAEVVHFNNAGAALVPRPVLDAQLDHLRLEARRGGYEAADEASDRAERAYAAIATMLGCHRDEIAVVENATYAWHMAFFGLGLGEGDRVLTAESEYASNYISYLQLVRRTGAVVDVVPSDDTGQISVAALASMIDDRVRLISIPHIPTNGGLINPVEEVGAIARDADVLYLLDACQSAGQLPLDVDAIGCDMLSATGRKYLRGPRGSGFLFVRRAVLDELEPPHLDLGSATWVARDRYEMRPDARRFENWEFNYAAKIGLGVAVDYALSVGLDAIAARVGTLAASLRRRVDDIRGADVADLGDRKCGIVGIRLDGADPSAVCAALRTQGINVSVTTRASTLLDMERRGLDTLLRASVHYYNTDAEIERFVEALAALL